MDYRCLTKEYLNTVLSYESGVLYWKYNPKRLGRWNSRYSNKPITCVGSHGYICFNLTYEGISYHLLAHRAIYCMEYGYWPKEIDHINGDRVDNHIGNLRECTSSENKINIPVRKHNANKVKGICRGKDKLDGTPRFLAYTAKNGKIIYLGTFNTAEDAKLAYDLSVQEIYGEFHHS